MIRLLAPLLVAVTAALLILGAADMPRRPYLGFAFRGNEVAIVDEGSRAAAAGLVPGDRIEQVIVHDPGDSLNLRLRQMGPADLWAEPRGTMVGLVVRGETGTARTVIFELAAPTPAEELRRWLNFFVALAALGAGFFTWYQRRGSIGRAFLFVCLALATIFRPPLPPTPAWLGDLDSLISNLAILALGAALVDWVVLLPSGTAGPRSRRLVMVGWIIAGLIGALASALHFGAPLPPIAETIMPIVATAFIAACLLGSIIRFLVTLARTRDRAESLRLRVVLWGGVLGLSPITLILILRNLTRLPVVAGEQFAVLAIAFLPLAWMYAIVRHRIFDIRLLLRRGVVAFLVTSILALGWFALVAFLGPRLDPRGGHPVVAFAALVLIALLFTGTRHVVQGVVDRFLFRADLSRRRRLEELSGRFTGILDSDQLAGSMLSELETRLGAVRSTLFTAGTNGVAPDSPRLPSVLRELFEHLDRPASRGDLIGRSPPHLKTQLAEKLAETDWEIFVPIRDGASLYAVAAFELGREVGGLDSRELAVLRRISRGASAALTSARRHRDERERDRLEGELELARNMQRHLLPGSPPLSPLVDLSGITLPGEAVGGDSHDFLRLPDGRIGLAVADVSGKGISAAILMASAQASFRALAEEGLDPGALLAALNRRLLEIDEPDRFLCFFYAVIDPATLALTAVNAGLEPPLLIGAAGEVAELGEGGVILGVLPGATYAEDHRELSSGDVLLVFSDGLVDARRPEDAPISRDRMIDLVRSRPGASASELRNAILGAAGLSGSVPLDDDVTLLVARIW